MVDAAEAALRFVSGRRRAELDTDRMLLFALVRAIEVLGEAAARTSPDLKAQLPDVPWQAMVGMPEGQDVGRYEGWILDTPMPRSE